VATGTDLIFLISININSELDDFVLF
jgi:hypothetical protein